MLIKHYVVIDHHEDFAVHPQYTSHVSWIVFFMWFLSSVSFFWRLWNVLESFASVIQVHLCTHSTTVHLEELIVKRVWSLNSSSAPVFREPNVLEVSSEKRANLRRFVTV